MANYIITKTPEYFKNIGDYNFCDISVLKNLPRVIAVDTETTGLHTHIGHRIFCVQIGTGKDNYIIDMISRTSPLFPEESYKFKDLQPYLENKIMTFHNATFDLGMFYAEGFYPDPSNIRDTMLAYFLLNNGRRFNFSFAHMMLETLGISYDKGEQSEINITQLSTAQTIEYCFNDVDRLLEAHEIMYSQLEENGQLEVYHLNCEFIPALAYYEQCGLPINESLWHQKVISDKNEMLQKAQDVVDYIYDNLPKYRKTQLDLFEENTKRLKIKITSAKQMISVFKDFEINVINDEGKESIDKSVLQKSGHEFIKIWFAYQDINHDVTTYGTNILAKIRNNRIYTRYKLMIDTGRLATRSDKTPGTTVGINFLNFPANEKTNRCFQAEKGTYIVGCDYAAQESRCLAAVTNDENSILNVLHDRDAHSLLARQAYPEIKNLTDKEIKDYHSDKRNHGKIANFTISFGGTGFTIAKNLGIEEELGNVLYNGYKELYPDIFTWGETIFREAEKTGYISSWGGYRFYLPEFDIFTQYRDDLKRISKEEWELYRTGKEQYNLWEESKKKNKEDETHPIYTITDIKAVRVYEQLKSIVSGYYKRKSKYMKLCLNNPIQSRAAWQTKLASTMVFREIRKRNDFKNVKMIVQIHDDIKLQVEGIHKAHEYRKILQDSMKKAAEFIVPHERVFFNAEAFIGFDCWDVKKETIFKEVLPMYNITDLETGQSWNKTYLSKPLMADYLKLKKDIEFPNPEVTEKDLIKMKKRMEQSYFGCLPETNPLYKYILEQKEANTGFKIGESRDISFSPGKTFRVTKLQ